jgi:hypothetical protein
MDPGKILMGTALILIMLGLLIQPSGAADTGFFSCDLQGESSGSIVPGHGGYTSPVSLPETAHHLQNVDTIISDT